MQKTKLGISIGLLGAAAYFAALLGSWTPVLLVAGYILLVEENDWLRRCAVRALVILAVITLTPAVLSLVENVFGLCNTVLGWFNAAFTLRFPGRCDYIIRYAVQFIGNGLLLILGVRALQVGSHPVAALEKFLDKHM